jgi:hypothetical protein
MNRKALQLAISTLIIFVLGIILLIGLVYILTDGFESLQSSTETFYDATQASSVMQGCKIACDTDNKITYCCKDFDIDANPIRCTDERLEIDCNLECEGFSCEGQLPLNELTEADDLLIPENE